MNSGAPRWRFGLLLLAFSRGFLAMAKKLLAIPAPADRLEGVMRDRPPGVDRGPSRYDDEARLLLTALSRTKIKHGLARVGA